jgi:hypothetical protein
MYAPGFYDYAGGELCFYNGIYSDDYGPEGCGLPPALRSSCGARAAAFAAVAAPVDDPAKAVRAREGEMEGFWAPHAT